VADGPQPPGAPVAPPDAAPAPARRAQQFRDILAGLRSLPGVRGGLIVTPDGLVVTADLPSHIPAEGLAALAATLGRELEIGVARLGHGAFRTASLSADDGHVLLGGSAIGFVILLGDPSLDPARAAPALRLALSHVEGAWKARAPVRRS
jgi:uncharacterized protein